MHKLPKLEMCNTSDSVIVLYLVEIDGVTYTPRSSRRYISSGDDHRGPGSTPLPAPLYMITDISHGPLPTVERPINPNKLGTHFLSISFRIELNG